MQVSFIDLRRVLVHLLRSAAVGPAHAEDNGSAEGPHRPRNGGRAHQGRRHGGQRLSGQERSGVARGGRWQRGHAACAAGQPGQGVAPACALT